MTKTRCLALAIALVALPLSACSSDGTKTTTAAPKSGYSAAPAALSGEILCPVCGAVVTTDSPAAMYGIYSVYCCSTSDAKQFASLSPKKRAELAAAQVLPQKRITNTTCPLTGEKLTAAAAPVMYEGVIIGFASTADANQFNALTAKKKQACIDGWKTASAASGSTEK